MKAFFAANAAFQAVLPPLHVRSRDTAIAAALGDEDQVAVHEQVVDPMVYRAASELVRLDDEGQKIDIEERGPVFDVLQSVGARLLEAGASLLAVEKILEKLVNHVCNFGADFARGANAAPLYARVIVTAKEPEDLPDLNVRASSFIVGDRIIGDDAGKMGMTLTLYGTANAMSKGMSMNSIFESSKKKGVFILFATIEGADLNKFDTVDASLANLIQAVGAGGGASVEEIRAVIENGTLAPEVKELIAAIAELNSTVEASRTPGAVENPAAKIAELKAAIAEIAQTIPDMQALPQVLVQAVAESMARVELSSETPDIAPPAEASNDNDTVMEQTASVLEQITALLQDEALPPEMKEALTVLVEKMDVAVADKDFSGIQAAMVEMRETLVDFAASDAVPAQLFHTISEILPAVVVAEKQLGDVAPRAVSPEIVPDVANLELAENVADIKSLLAEKIDVLLKDEALPPEIKEQLVKIVQTMESAMDQKDFAKLVIATTEMRQALTDFAANDALPPQLTKQLAEILPVIVSSEQKLADVVPRAQAENILVALMAADQKLQSGDIILAPETVQLVQALDALKETIKQQGPDAALQKIVESLKAPAADGAIVPVLDVLAKNPVLLQALPPELGHALAQAVPPAERSIQQHLAVAGIAAAVPVVTSEKIIDVLLAVEKHIEPADIKADPAKAELAKIIADLKQTIDKEGMPAAVQKITEAMQQVSLDGKASPILEILSSQPALLAALPVELQANVQQLKESSVLVNVVVAQQAEKIIDVVTAIDQKIQSGVIDKADPANAELVKVIAEIKETIKQEGLPAAAEKIAEALKQVSIDGKTPPIIEVLASQPALLSSLPPELQRSVEQVQKTALSVALPAERQAEKIVAAVTVLDQKIQSGAIDKADPANAELIKIVADIKKSMEQGGTPAAVEKIAEVLKQVTIDGKTPPIIEMIATQPALLAALPPELRTSIQQIQQTMPTPVVPIQQKAEKIVAAITTLDQKLQSGAIDKTDPANAELVKAIADIKKTMEQGGTPAAVEKITEALKQVTIDGKTPPIIEAIATQPALLVTLPPELRTSIQQVQQTIPAPAIPAQQQAEKIVAAVTTLDQQIKSGAIDRADPANAELIKTIAEIKKTIDQGGAPAAVEKITEALKQASVDGKMPPVIEAIATQPALLSILPPQVRSSVEQFQQTALLAAAPVKLQAEKIVDVVKVLDQQIQNGTIDKSNTELVKIVADIKKTMDQGGVPAAVEKITEALKQVSIDGKAPPIIEVLASQPALLAALPPQLRSSVEQIHQTVAVAAAPVKQAQQIVEAVKAIDAQMQAGAIDKSSPANAELAKAIADIKETIKQGGAPAAVEKITEALKQVSVDGSVPPIVTAIVAQPAILAALPQDVRASMEKIQQTASAVVPPVAQQAKAVSDVVAVLDQKIQSGAINKADPANAEVIALVAQIKETAKTQGNAAVAEKITEALQRVSVDGKIPQIIEVLAKNPAVLAAVPELQRTVQQVHMTAAAAVVPVKQQAEKIIHVVDAIQQSVQSGAISKADPANAAIITAIENIRQIVGKEGATVAAQKFAESLQQASVDGKVPLIVAAIAKNPAVFAALPPEAQRTIVQLERTAAVAVSPVREHAEKIIAAVAALDKTAPTVGLSKADPNAMAMAAAIAEIKQTLHSGGTEAAVLKVSESINRAIETGKMPPLIKAVMDQPAVLAALPAQTRIDLQNAQQKIQLSTPQVEVQSRYIVNTFAAVEQSIKRGDIPVSADVVRTIADIKVAMQADGGKAFVKDLGASIKAADARVVEMAAVLAKPEILKSLPVAVQKEIVNFQRTAIDAEAKSSVLRNEVVTITPRQQRDLQALVEKSNLPPVEIEKYRSEIQSGRISLGTAAKMLDGVESKSPALDTSKVRNDLGSLAMSASAKINTPIDVKVEPAFQRQTVSAIVRLPLSSETVTRVIEGRITKADVVAIQLAAGPTPTKAESRYIAAAIKPILQEQGRAAVVMLEKGPAPSIPKVVVDSMRDGRPITRAQYREIMSDPAKPAKEKQAVQNYVAAQLQVLPHSQKTQEKTTTVWKEIKSTPVYAEPKHSVKEQLFQPSDKEKFVKIITDASVNPKDMPVVKAIVAKVEAGEPISHSQMSRLMEVAKLTPMKHLEISANMLPVTETKNSPEAKKEEPESGCPTGCDGEKGCCDKFNKVSHAEIKKTAEPLMADFIGYGISTKESNANPLQVDVRVEKLPDLELKDFLETEKEKPETGCPTECDRTKGCCPAFDKATATDAAKIANPLKEDFVKFYGTSSVPNKTFA